MGIQLSYLNAFSSSIFIVLLLSACNSDVPTDDSKPETLVRPAKLIEVSQASTDQFLNYPAVIKSSQLKSLYFEVGGKLNELPVIEAQQVKKGDVLAKLDQRDLQATLASAKAQYENANIEYQRGVRLLKENAISKSQVEERKSKRNVSKSSLDTAQKALQDSVLIAPYDGTIAKVSIAKQQVVQAGKPVIDILGKGGLEAAINLPSSILARVDKDKAPATDSYIVLDAKPDLQVPATFKEAALQADAASQTYAVTFTFDAPEDLVVLPGMNAVVWFRDPSRSSTNASKIAIPLTAIATDGDQKYVWVVDSDAMTVSKRNIEAEKDVGTRIGVISGLDAGETIVSAGISALSEGMKVSRWSK